MTGRTRPATILRCNERAENPAFLHRDARLPEERSRLRQGRRVASLADGLVACRRRRRGRSRRGEHLRLHRGRTPGVDRHRPGALADIREAGRAARGHGLHGRALRRRARRRRSPRSTRWSGSRARARSARRSSLGMPRSKPDRGARPARAAPRRAEVPWAYLKVAEGCDRACAFCAIPSFRGKQRSRTPESIEAEARALVDGGVAELVLVAQDLAWYGRDAGEPGSLAPLLRRLDRSRPDGLARVRLLYLYPSEVRDPLIVDHARAAHGRPLLRPLAAARRSPRCSARMKRWGSGDKFLTADRRHPRAGARRHVPVVVHRRLPRRGRVRTRRRCSSSSHRAELDWAGFFSFSHEDGTAGGHAARRGAPEPSRSSGCANVKTCRSPSRVPRATRSSAWRSPCSSTGATTSRVCSSAAPTAKRPRSTASCTSTPTGHVPGALVHAHVTDAFGTDLVAKGLP